jgi:hypothetical protein
MTLRSVIATAVLGLSVLACSGESTTTAETQNDKLSSPWKELNLPVGDGEILVNSSEQLLIGWEQFDGGLSALDGSWKSTIESAGYKQVDNLSGDGINAYIFQKDSAMLGLATLEDEGVFGAYMEDLGKVKDSQIKKGGVRDTVRSKRGRGGGAGGAPPAKGNKAGGGAPGGSTGGKGGGGKGGKGGR